MINTELQKKLDELQEPNRTILMKLIEDIERQNHKDDIKATVRSSIREYVTMEMKK